MHTGMIKSNAWYDKIEKKNQLKEPNEYEISIWFDFERLSRYLDKCLLLTITVYTNTCSVYKPQSIITVMSNRKYLCAKCPHWLSTCIVIIIPQ